MAGWKDIDAYLTGKGIRIGPPTLGQTTGGTHAAGSYHYLGLARDYGASNSDSDAVFAALAPFASGPNPTIIELYGSNGQGYKNGVAVNGAQYDPASVAPASKHTHAAISAGGKLSDQGRTVQAQGGVTGIINDIPGVGAVTGAASDAAGAFMSVSRAIATFTEWIMDRGKFLLLVGAGLIMIVMGFQMLTKDLTLPTVVKTAAKVAVL